MKKILIITHSRDNGCIAKVAANIKTAQGTPVVLLTDQYPTDCYLSSEYTGSVWQHLLYLNDEVHNLADFEAIWYRRVNLAANLPDMEEDLRQPAVEESRRTFFGLLASLDIFQLDRVPRIRYAEIKQLQLQVAGQLGLRIPATLFTNHADSVKNFYAKHPAGIITKMQAAFAVYREGQEHVVFTNTVSESELEDIDSITLCPMTFQEKIEKVVELRITVVGDAIFAAQIDSQRFQLTQNDWRRDGVGLIPEWEQHTLPESIKTKLLALMDHFQLNYGAIDMILTPEGEYVFLEVNPCGEFFWLEEYTKLPITQAITNVLLGRGKRR